MTRVHLLRLLPFGLVALCGCGADNVEASAPPPPLPSGSLVDAGVALPAPGTPVAPPSPPDASADAASTPPTDVYGYANGCFAVSSDAGRVLAATSDAGAFSFVPGDSSTASRFFLKASDLGTYLFYDAEKGYLVSEGGALLRQTTLQSDILNVDDTYVSGAEWELIATGPTSGSAARFHLRHWKTKSYLGTTGLVSAESAAAQITLDPRTGCTPHPELTLDATGQVKPQVFADGSLYGIVETHTHIMSNFGFGGGGIFHGAPFHRLGVQHALSDCTQFHGVMGRKDFFGFGFDSHGGFDAATIVPAMLAGQLPQDNHETFGYPYFTGWPNAPHSSTHQTQYYAWLQRAYLAGLRLVVQHATTNEAICNLMVGQNYQKVRYACNDMVAVDRSIAETYAMERYIDAQSGGPGLGFFRVVKTPSEARGVIRAGKMAVVLGIETSNLFNCLSVPRAGSPVCDEAYVEKQLDAYYALGVRAMFPVHKYDNAFSAGDGNRGFIELGNFLNSGQWSNFVQDCPNVPAVFDHGDVSFGGLNAPRAQYMSTPPVNMSTFPAAPLLTLTPYIPKILQPALSGDYCQNAGLTPLGESLLHKMMLRGMIIEIDHLPRRSYQRAFELLDASHYPAAATHGSTFGGKIYEIGGVSKANIGRCRDPNRQGAMLDDLRNRVAAITAKGGYPAEGLGFDLNGFAGAPGPRFGSEAGCSAPQTDPVKYPFTSYSGDVTFTQPQIGNRVLDFNSEGLVHIGLLPELLDDARRDAASDADLEPLFRSAEGYLRMWERAEARATVLRSMP